MFNNWDGKVDEGGNMELSDTIGGDDTKMSDIPNTKHCNKGRKKPRQKTPVWSDDESEDGDEKDKSGKNRDDIVEEEGNGEGNSQSATTPENSNDIAMETTGNGADSTNRENSVDTDMGNTENNVEDSPNSQHSPTHINHDFV